MLRLLERMRSGLKPEVSPAFHLPHYSHQSGRRGACTRPSGVRPPHMIPSHSCDETTAGSDHLWSAKSAKRGGKVQAGKDLRKRNRGIPPLFENKNSSIAAHSYHRTPLNMLSVWILAHISVLAAIASAAAIVQERGSSDNQNGYFHCGAYDDNAECRQWIATTAAPVIFEALNKTVIVPGGT